MPIRLIGKHGHFKGKTLYQLALNLKNFGVGRVVTRQAFQRYPEKSYYILTKVVPVMSDTRQSHGEAWGHRVFRGEKFEGIRKIDVGYKRDWLLIPKEDQEEFCRLSEKDFRPDRTVPNFSTFPPLLESLIKQEKAELGEDVSVPLKLPLKTKNLKHYNKGLQTPT
ncbi:hypothetical protein ScPMuIL_003804 [Solemya velum]